MSSARGPEARIALLMISNFGVADGGRETWAYNFIPRLLERWPQIMLDIIGLHWAGQPDNKGRLEQLLGHRGRVTFLTSKRKRFPVLSALRQASHAAPAVPDLVIGVGSAIDVLVILFSPALRRAKRIIWLRTILTHERAKQLRGWLGYAVRALEIRLLSSADVLIANGEDTAAYYRGYGLKVTVIPNGVDVDRWRSVPPRIGRRISVAFVGRLLREKGLSEFLTVAERLHHEGTFEFHVIGEGPGVPQVLRAHQEGWLVHHGAMPNDALPDTIAKMDVCVAFTFKSSSGGGAGVSNALLEQMASGRVILAWRTEIYQQLLDDTNAWLIQQGDVDGLEQALREILAQPDEARRRAAAGQKTAERFSYNIHLDKFIMVAEPMLTGLAKS
jgi:glycosyltransferase involved in cell wall biosynthesis